MKPKKTKEAPAMTTAQNTPRAENAILPSERPKAKKPKGGKLVGFIQLDDPSKPLFREATKAEKAKEKDKKGKEIESVGFPLGFESETDEAYNERTKAEIAEGMAKVNKLRRKPQPQEAPEAPATAPRLPQPARIAKAAKQAPAPAWTPEKPYSELITEEEEVKGYAKADHGPEGVVLWVAYNLDGKTVCRAMSASTIVPNFIKKTGHKVSPRHIA